MVNCNSYQHSYDYQCTLQDCINAGDIDCTCPLGFSRDCNRDCRVEGSETYAYLTDCGCNTNGGKCPTFCSTQYGLGQTHIGPYGSISSNYYCYDSYYSINIIIITIIVILIIILLILLILLIILIILIIIILIILIIILIQPLRAFHRAHLGENVCGGLLGSLWALWELVEPCWDHFGLSGSLT